MVLNFSLLNSCERIECRLVFRLLFLKFLLILAESLEHPVLVEVITVLLRLRHIAIVILILLIDARRRRLNWLFKLLSSIIKF